VRPAAPVFRPAERLTTVANPEPVRIVIDRIEVRPAATPIAPDRPPQRTRPGPPISLDEYLRRGSGERS
jgi:hypothetical protein